MIKKKILVLSKYFNLYNITTKYFTYLKIYNKKYLKRNTSKILITQNLITRFLNRLICIAFNIYNLSYYIRI